MASKGLKPPALAFNINARLVIGSRHHGDKNPVWFTLGIREAIKGWDKGLQGMCAGEKRKLTIPPSLAYGKEGKGVLARCIFIKHYLRNFGFLHILILNLSLTLH